MDKAKSAKRNYLTKRVLKRAAKSGIKKAAKKSMRVMGYVVVAEKGWVVKKYPGGKTEKISRIHPVKRTKKIVLD